MGNGGVSRIESSSPISSVSVASSSSSVGSSSSYLFFCLQLSLHVLFLFQFETHLAWGRLLLALLNRLQPVPPFQIPLVPPQFLGLQRFLLILNTVPFLFSD